MTNRRLNLGSQRLPPSSSIPTFSFLQRHALLLPTHRLTFPPRCDFLAAARAHPLDERDSTKNRSTSLYARCAVTRVLRCPFLNLRLDPPMALMQGSFACALRCAFLNLRLDPPPPYTATADNDGDDEDEIGSDSEQELDTDDWEDEESAVSSEGQTSSAFSSDEEEVKPFIGRRR